jgi:hypothetical protein
MGLDFIRRCAPTFTKAWNRGKHDLATPTLFSNTPWHSSGNHSLCLGYQDCFFFHPAGDGLEVPAALYNCTDFCRSEDPSACANVCPNQPVAFAARLQEVRGFALDNVPTALLADTRSLATLTVPPACRETGCHLAV